MKFFNMFSKKPTEAAKTLFDEEVRADKYQRLRENLEKLRVSPDETRAILEMRDKLSEHCEGPLPNDTALAFEVLETGRAPDRENLLTAPRMDLFRRHTETLLGKAGKHKPLEKPLLRETEEKPSSYSAAYIAL